jgi:hypothetical protein
VINFHTFVSFQNNFFCTLWLFFSVKKGQCYEIFDFRFSTWISLTQTPDYTFRANSKFFRNFAEIFAAQGAPQVSLAPVVHLELENGKKSSSFIISFGHLLVVELAKRKNCFLQVHLIKVVSSLMFSPFFATGVVDTSGKFSAGIVDTGGKFATGINDTCGIGVKFAAGVIATGSAPCLANISKNFRKNLKWP